MPLHSVGVQYPKTPKLTPLYEAMGIDFMTGVVRQDSRRKTKDINNKIVRGVAGRSMIDAGIQEGFEMDYVEGAYALEMDERRTRMWRNMVATEGDVSDCVGCAYLRMCGCKRRRGERRRGCNSYGVHQW